MVSLFCLNLAALIRNNKPGILSFKQANGYAALQNALGTDHVRFQRFSSIFFV